MLNKAFVLFFLLIPILLFSQKKPIKFGDVKPSDLAMTSYEKDPDADGVVLCNYGQVDFEVHPGEGFNYRLKHHKRIKIFKRSAFDEADISIHFHKDFQKIARLKANVYSPDGTTRELSKKEFFEEEIEDGWTAKKMALPNIEEGSVIEYKYDLVSENLSQLRPWYFSETLPTIWSEFRVAIPEYFKYHRHAHGWGTLTVNECEVTNGSTAGETFREEDCRYVAEHMPAYKREAYITTLEDYFFKLKFQLRAIQIGSYYKSYLSTWEEVAKVMRESDTKGRQYLNKRKSNDLVEATQSLFVDSEAETVDNLSEFILNNIKTTDYNTTYFSEKSLDDAFEKKMASKAEKNLMLLALLRAKGMKADPVYISTRRNGRPISVQPNINQFDHVLVRAKIGEEYQLLDLSSEFRVPDLLDPQCLNLEGFIVTDNGSDWIPIPNKLSANVVLSTISIAENGDISGTLATSEKGYQAAYSRANLEETKGDELWKENLKERFPEAKFSNFKAEALEDLHSSLKTEVEISIPEAAQISDDLMYVTPVIFTDFDENPFKLETRSFPIDFPYPMKEQLIMNIDIPEGYQIEELPESVSILLPNGGGKFLFQVSEKKGGGIQIVSKVNIKQLLFLPEEYTTIKNFWDLIVEKMGEQIVLKKV